MKTSAQSAYAAYQAAARLDHPAITTAQLSTLYNIACRIRRDEAYRRELDAFVTDEGEPIAKLIESFFTAYNARHGLDIRETLTEFEDPDLIEGAYFLIDTFRSDGGVLTPTDATAFSVGDTAHAVLRLMSRASHSPIRAARIRVSIQTDDGEACEKTFTDADAVSLDFALSRPGWAYFKAEAVDAEGQRLPGFDVAFGGVLFDFEQIPLTKESPDDLRTFWEAAIDRLLTVDPVGETPDGYEGQVAYEYDMPAKNHFKLVKLDAAFIRRLRELGIITYDESVLETHDFYEVNLKAPGPCHSANYLSIPRGKAPKSLSMTVQFDGYTAYPLVPTFLPDQIVLHCSHHGYDLPNPLEGYYMKLRTGVCMRYGLGDGSVNAMYDDLCDNYMIYLHLRNLQAIRFVTDPAYASLIPEMHAAWNGDVNFWGGSMGGYQALCTGALSTIFTKKCPFYHLTHIWATIPAFCNLAGRTDGRVPGFTHYTEGMEYFDAAHLASWIDVPVQIDRTSLGDITCPPNGIAAMYARIPSGVHKEINFLQNSDHGTLPDPERQMWFRYQSE